MKTIERLYEFHIGRGGRHNNEGHVTFVKEVKGIYQTNAFHDLYPPKYKNGNDNLITLNAEWLNCSGNGVGLTNQDVKNGYGRIDFDGGYDTTYVIRGSELNAEEIVLMYVDGFFKYESSYYYLAELLDLPIEKLKISIEEGDIYELIRANKN